MKRYPLMKHVIEEKIPKKFIWLYYLWIIHKWEFRALYVWRSDTLLKRRLLQHNRVNRYTHFAFIKTETIIDAFLLECRERHRLRKLNNKIHPNAPKRLPYRCPYCGIEKEFKSLLS